MTYAPFGISSNSKQKLDGSFWSTKANTDQLLRSSIFLL